MGTVRRCFSIPKRASCNSENEAHYMLYLLAFKFIYNFEIISMRQDAAINYKASMHFKNQQCGMSKGIEAVLTLILFSY